MVGIFSSPDNRRCALYKPGHKVHVIQARLAWENPQDDIRAEFLGVEDGVILVGTERGEIKRFRNHNLERLASIVKHMGSRVVLRSRGVLSVPNEEGAYYFCVKEDDGEPLDPCVDPDDVPTDPAGISSGELARLLVDRAEELGGFIAWRPENATCGCYGSENVGAASENDRYMNESICTLSDLFALHPWSSDELNDERMRVTGWTWRDPRSHPAGALDGPLGRTIVVDGSDELSDACLYAMTHTFLEAQPMNHHDPTWERDGVWIMARASDDASAVEVRTRLVGLEHGADQAKRITRKFWRHPGLALGADEFGTYASTPVSAKPLVLADLASALLHVCDATTEFFDEVGAAGLPFTTAAESVEFEYHFCGTGLLAETGKYGNTDEHPLVGREDDDE